MRPVVFGPSPFMQAALGVLGGKQAGEQRVAAENALARKTAREDEDRALDVAHRIAVNGDLDLKARDRKAKKDYIKRQLIDAGYPDDEAEFWANEGLTKEDLAERKVKAEEARTKHAADVELTKARTEAARRAPVDPFARMAETFRQQSERASADKWQAIYLEYLKPKYNSYGQPIEGTGMTPAAAAKKADEAMGGRPNMAPKVPVEPPEPPEQPPPLGTGYSPTGAR